MNLNILLVLLLLCLVPYAFGVDYCDKKLTCIGKVKHVCCKPDKVKSCKPVLATFTFRRAIVKAQNRIRSQVQRGSRNLLGDPYKVDRFNALNWDMALEEIAACWAKRCEVGRAPCSRHPQSDKVTQSMFITVKNTDKQKHVDNLVEDWYNELSDMNSVAPKQLRYELNRYSGDFDDYISGFVNLVYAHSTHVGCARAKQRDSVFVVCNYYPGPQYGQPLIANNTDKCPGKPNQYYKNLCGETTWSRWSLRKGTFNAARRARPPAPLLILLLPPPSLAVALLLTRGRLQ